MKKSLSIILPLFLVAFIFMINKGPSDTRLIDTHVSLTTNEMISLLDTENSKHLDSYIEKAIEIKGILKEKNYKRGKHMLLLAGRENTKFILCEMQDDQASKIQNLELEKQVIIKGIFKGVLLDAILLNCILIDNEVYE
ncbi:MAG: hypothetical protein JKY02_04150 [Flavobacteriaceae bacterium]|nr:hypothetical protein [Flavobacteriaceae bacterium]